VAHDFPEEANDILALLMRHWNDIAATLSKAMSICRFCWRTRMACRTAMTGRVASCGAWRCATKAGLN
jgi:hypothetical protein